MQIPSELFLLWLFGFPQGLSSGGLIVPAREALSLFHDSPISA
ncbi:hypothetical protein ACPOL_3264 [Acidisarcina polymorpha]|uniref:Uncharacterized protein n=1 Tax=Acidisarcina polymorpha TaxID=2211140 RepID=A0A2Z5G1E1_9BACT|nr:hypothetical protein ACPOL_3264 [Acidisarcina polymorpha]